jgi:hypothetical protein
MVDKQLSLAGLDKVRIGEAENTDVEGLVEDSDVKIVESLISTGAIDEFEGIDEDEYIDTKKVLRAIRAVIEGGK